MANRFRTVPDAAIPPLTPAEEGRLGLGPTAKERRNPGFWARLKGKLVAQLDAIRLLGNFPDWVQRNARFILFLVLVGMVYIWNSHSSERQVRRIDQLEQQLKELKAQHMTLNASLSQSRRQSHIAPLADSLLGLKHSTTPPVVLKRTQPIETE